MRRPTAVIPLRQLEERARGRPPSYYIEVVLAGRVVGDALLLPWPVYHDLARWWGRGEAGYASVLEMTQGSPDDAHWQPLKALASRQAASIARARSTAATCHPCLLAKLQALLLAAARKRRPQG